MVQPTASKRNALHDLGYKIFLDRYAQKDMTRETLAVGDIVIVVVNPQTGQREIGTVEKINLPKVTIQLNDGDVVERDIEHVDKPLETDPAQMMDRVARGIAEIEKTPELREKWSEEFRWLLEDWKFVPGGRILTAAGTNQELTFYNCMPPEQEILTKDGYQAIADVHVGDYVVTHRNRLRKVLRKFERETEEPLYIIKPKKVGYDDLRVTGEHKIYIIRSEWVNKSRARDGLRLKEEPQWIPANELKPSDYVAVAYDGDIRATDVLRISDYIGIDVGAENELNYADSVLLTSHSAYEVENGQLLKATTYADGTIITGKRPLPLNNELLVDEDLCYLFGRWLGDGCIVHRTGTDIPAGIKIVFNLDEISDAQEIAAIIEAKFGISADIKLSSTTRWYDLWVNSMPVGEFFKALLGVYSHSKRIPQVLMRLSNEKTLALLRGLFTADGYVSGSYIGMLLSNRELTTQVHQLLLRLGYFFSITENTHKNGRVPAFRLSATGTEADDLFKYFFNKQSTERGHNLQTYIEYDNLRWVRIAEIGIEDYAGLVLDIEVEEDHSFVSAGVVVSNCYVVPSPSDSRGGIMNTLTYMTEIMSRGGGVGMNLSTLRPRHAYVKGVNGRSSGSVSWGGLYSFVTGLIEQGGCFGPDERIMTDKGLIPAVELADCMDTGEEFFAHTHKGLRKITARFRNGVKPLYEVTTDRGYKVRITEDHKVAVLMDGEITTMPLKYLQEGDEILLLLGNGNEGDFVALEPLEYERSIMSTTLNTDVKIPEAMNDNLAYLIGYSIGDGYVQMGKKVNWEAPKALKLATADSHPTIRERLIRITEEQFGLNPTIEDGDGACANVAIYSRMLIEWLIQNNLLKAKSENIRVPEVIFRSPSSVQLAFIAGYFDADGSNRKRKGGYGIDSISREMLEDVQILLGMNGIVSRLHTTERPQENWKTIYRLNVTGSTFRKLFAELVPAEKVSDDNGKRDMYNTYPAQVWTSLGERSKYRQRIYDGQSSRISTTQLKKISTRLSDDGRVESAERIQNMLNTMPDTITSIDLIGDNEVYDFEVADVHLVSGNIIYTHNSRRGALMLILNDWHPDVFDFINSKRVAGQITNANISVGVSDKLMEAVKNDGDWDLVFPDTSDPDYDDLWDGDLDTWATAGRKVLHYKTIKARELWDAIIESAWASAEPGVWFRERSNKMSNSWYFNPLISTNPCVTGDTRIYTDKGLIQARELFDDETEISVAIDGRFGLEENVTPSTRVFMTGVKPVYRLQTKEGYYLRATADHRIMTPRGWVELQDLKPKDKIHILNRKGGFGQEGSLELGRVLGWLVGDGTINQDRAVLSFFGDEKRELAPLFAQYVTDIVEPITKHPHRSYPVGVSEIADRDEARVGSQRLSRLVTEYGLADNKHQVPEIVYRGTEDMQRGFLQALFTADGSFQDGRQKGGSIRLASSKLELLEQSQMLLGNFGIASRIYQNRREAGYRELPDGKGGKAPYWTQAQHELVISKSNMITFANEIGFLMNYKQEGLEDYITRGKRGPYREHFLTTVESIVADGEEEVFDLIEPRTHSFSGNNVILHNCGEQSLGGWSVCNLGAINLSNYYDANRDDVDWALLDKSVRIATRFLDNVIDTTPYFFQQNEDMQLSERRVGLGTMGIAELMLKCQIRYGSDESVEFIEKVYKTIACAAYETSAELAAEKGAFPQFDTEKFLESGFMKHMPDSIRDIVSKKGIRNVTLLTQAPTGTTGTMVNTSTGIEPFFSWVYYRKSRLGLHEEQSPIVAQYYKDNPDATELPDYFVTAMDLAPREHVKVQGAFQKWIDSAISKTSNVPNHYTVEQVSDLYMYMYDIGCKGGTIYRDGSRDEQVLMLKGDERAESEMEEVKGKKSDTPKEPTTTPHRVYPRPNVLNGTTVRFNTPFGKSYITMNSDKHDNPFEVFITVGKAGSDIQADAEALGRMISLQLRTTAPHNRREMLKLIVEQLQDIGGARPIGLGPKRVLSLPDAVGRALMEHYINEEELQQLGLPINGGSVAPKKVSPPAEDSADEFEEVNGNGYKTRADICPDCGTISLIRAEGCRKCLTCGYSEC